MAEALRFGSCKADPVIQRHKGTRLRLFSYFSASNDGKIKGENRKLKSAPKVSVVMQALSMHLLELTY